MSARTQFFPLILGTCVLACAALAAGARAQNLPAAPALSAAVDLDPDPATFAVALVVEALPEADPRRAAGYRYTYNGQVTPPLFSVAVGTVLDVRLENRLAVPFGLRFAGAGAPYAVDAAPLDLGQGAPPGVVPAAADPGLTAPGATRALAFPLSRAGTFTFRPHLGSEASAAAELVGALVVTDPAADGPQAADIHEITWIFDAPGEDVRATPEAAAADPNAPVTADAPTPTVAGIAARRAAAGRGHRPHQSRWRINGAEAPVALDLDARPLRLRIINASSTRHLALRLRGLQQVAGDAERFGAPLGSGPFVLAPGDRGTFVFDPAATPETGDAADRRTLVAEPFSLNGGFTSGEALPLAVLRAGPGGLPPLLDVPFSGAAVGPEPTHTDLLWVLTGTDRTGVALLNGLPYPRSRPVRLARGARPIVEVRNLSSSHRSFAVQGQTFEVLSIDGVAPPTQRIEDTLDIPIRAQVRLRLRADNPGLWQVGSPTEPHAGFGLLGLLRVE